MKFARYLEENAVDEWRKAYINYRGLKKVIKRVAIHHEARLSLELSASSSRASQGVGAGAIAGAGDSPRRPRPTSPLAARQSARQTSDYGGTARSAQALSAARTGENAAEEITPGPPVTLDGTGLTLPLSDPSGGASIPFEDSDDTRVPPRPAPADVATVDVEAHPSHLGSRHRTLTARRDHQTDPEVEADEAGDEAEDDKDAKENAEGLRSPTYPRAAHVHQTLYDSIPFPQPAGPVVAPSLLGVGRRRANSASENAAARGVSGGNVGSAGDAGSVGRANMGMTAPWSASNRSGLRLRKNKPRYPTSLAELLTESFDSEERKFFSATDSELERIVSFYEARERDASQRFEVLARQLKELAEHRRGFKARHAGPPTSAAAPAQAQNKGRDLHWKNVAKPLFGARAVQAQTENANANAHAHAGPYVTTDSERESIPPAKMSIIDGHNAPASAADKGDRRRSLALARAAEASAAASAASDGAGGGNHTHRDFSPSSSAAMPSAPDDDTQTDAADRKANRAAALSHDPERYKHARKKLKAAILEYYRGLEILKNYKILNRTGFAKILKKFEKTLGIPCADAYFQARVAPSILITSERVEKLIKSTEEIYTAYFEHGNRKKAIDRLRVTAPDSTRHHFSVFRTGVYIGIAICATAAGLVEAMQKGKHEGIPQWQGLLRVYGAEFIPTLFALLFGLNLAAWNRARINTPFIFEWDVRHSMDYHRFFEIPAVLMLCLALCFWMSFLNPFPASIAPTTWPLVWLVIVLVMLLNPLPLFARESRRWFVRSLLRVFGAGALSRVEFRDFFLGDELNSLAFSMSTLWYFGCEYKHDWAVPSRCDPNGTFWTAVLSALPALLRLGQCFRRYKDSNYTANLHLVNAGKYASSVLNAFFYFNYRLHGSHRKEDLALWCVFGVIYSLYTSAWDILMDWSLLKPHARYPFLRNELAWEEVYPIYYFAIVTDILIRFAWVIYLIPGPASSLTKVFIIALLEMFRRWQWNTFRLENEHLGNVDMYRVSKDVPLPYRIPDSAEDDGSDDEGGGGSTKRSQQRAPATGPHSSVRLRPTKWARKGGAGAGAGGASGAGAGGESGSEGANPESVRRKSLVADLLGRLRQSLLPDGEAEAEGHVGGTGTDARSAAAEGPSLGIDQQGGAKGGAGRDYEPRTPELEGESDLENTGDSEIAHEAERDGDADEDGDTFSIRSDKRGSRLGLGL